MIDTDECTCFVNPYHHPFLEWRGKGGLMEEGRGGSSSSPQGLRFDALPDSLFVLPLNKLLNSQ